MNLPDANLIILVVCPVLFMGLLCMYFMNTTLKKEQIKQRFQWAKAHQKEILPLQLQAYERITLFLERISIQKLVTRVSPVSGCSPEEYLQLLVATIDQELDHNLTQQLYLSNESWNAVLASKNMLIKDLYMMLKSSEAKEVTSYRNALLTSAIDQNATNMALQLLKADMKLLLNPF